MQISSRFTIAIHMFACIDVFASQYKLTSDFIATSVNVNPVVIRRLLQQLKSAGLISVQRGQGGASIARPLDEITFFDIYKAVDCVDNGQLFHFHENPNAACPVGSNIHNVLDRRLSAVQLAMEAEMKKITIADVVKDTKQFIEKVGQS